jgi:aminoglycoside/choline kinase family phosphotransferase
MSDRRSLVEGWVRATLGVADLELEPASSDASFRRYWRVRHGGGTVIAMDAPPEHEDCGRFVHIARQLRAIGLNTPEILAQDLGRGLLLIGDLGEGLYLDALGEDSVERLYGDALAALAAIQACGPTDGLPVYDGPFLRREMDIFREWLLDKHLGLALSAQEAAMLDGAFDCLVANALEQPQVCVHRDFHSRNLMVVPTHNPGVLDFQDAVVGPVTYDLVSLLRDCYIAWPRARVEEWAAGYFALAVQSGVLEQGHEGRFLRWFDLMGMQRHLKASGIFARLHRRDGKPGYLADIPRTLGYVVEVAAGYPDLRDLGRFVQERVLPAL